MQALFRSLISIVLIAILCGVGACNRCKDHCVHGTCIKRSCSCDEWYGGDACDRSILTKYEGFYRGTLKGDSVLNDVALNLQVAQPGPESMVASGLGLVLTFTTSSRFEVTEQTFQGVVMKGEGEMLVDLISVRLDPVDEEGVGSLLIEARKQD